MKHKFVFACLLIFPLHLAVTMIYADVETFVVAEPFFGRVISIETIKVSRLEGGRGVVDLVDRYDVVVTIRSVDESNKKSHSLFGDEFGFKSYNSLDTAKSAISASKLVGTTVSAWCARKAPGARCRSTRLPRFDTVIFGGTVFAAFLVLVYSSFRKAS